MNCSKTRSGTLLELEEKGEGGEGKNAEEPGFFVKGLLRQLS